jgi:ketosteroid isomerase-like protein
MTSSAAMKEAVRAAFADLARGEVGTVTALLAPDVVYTVIGDTALSGVLRGRDAVMTKLWGSLAASLATPLTLDIRGLTAEGDRIVMQAAGHARLKSGAPYDNTYCFVFRVAGTQVTEVTEYLDTALVGRAFAVPPDERTLLRAMDLNMWAMFRELIRLARGGEVRETARFTMAAHPEGTPFHNMVMVHEPIEAGTLLAAIEDFHGRRGLPFSVWTRAHADQALEAELQQRGFHELLSMPAMALLGDPGTRVEPKGLDIRRTTTDQGRRDYLEVTAEAYAVYGQPRAFAEAAFASLESVCAPHVQGFVGYLDGKPVAAAALWLSHGVGGINWVGTTTEHRGRGFAEAVTWAAVREGFRRGAAFANLQASPMGRPVYERMGFITPSHYRVLIGSL